MDGAALAAFCLTAAAACFRVHGCVMAHARFVSRSDGALKGASVGYIRRSRSRGDDLFK